MSIYFIYSIDYPGQIRFQIGSSSRCPLAFQWSTNLTEYIRQRSLTHIESRTHIFLNISNHILIFSFILQNHFHTPLLLSIDKILHLHIVEPHICDDHSYPLINNKIIVQNGFIFDDC
jgi:hypothetical protein